MDQLTDINLLATDFPYACDNEVCQPSGSREFLRWVTNARSQQIATAFRLEFFPEHLQAAFDFDRFKAHEFIIHDHAGRRHRYHANVAGGETDEC
ncbi:hypothetical protein N184_28830 [Sinorhizobium sp. GL28]|nr:hypothetical protein N184_28830 [Sinorhizobium sp. GL28]